MYLIKIKLDFMSAIHKNVSGTFHYEGSTSRAVQISQTRYISGPVTMHLI